MVAIVTSTLQPAENKSYYTHNERLAQTTDTLQSLQTAGFEQIFLIDNSPGLNVNALKQLLADYKNVRLFHVDQYQFINKGINEILMLLFICQHLPPHEAIFKISGRYKIREQFKNPSFTDMAVKGYQFDRKNGTISTRAYWVKNAELFDIFLNECLRVVYAYPERVVGLRSFIKKIKHIITGKPQPGFELSIEMAAANVLKHSGFSTILLNELNIEGCIAGSDHVEKLVE